MVLEPAFAFLLVYFPLPFFAAQPEHTRRSVVPSAYALHSQCLRGVYSVAFGAASFSVIGKSAGMTFLCPLAVAFVVVDSALTTCCFTTFSIVTACVDESIDGLGRVKFKDLSRLRYPIFPLSLFRGLRFRKLNLMLRLDTSSRTC